MLDGLDGRIARMTKSTSGFGVQYDSLADLVAFGVAPALLVYLWALKPFQQFGWVAAFLFVVCGALRLARFNVQQGSMDPRYFNGLPIPAAAMLIATSIAFYYEIGEWAPEKHVYILAMIYVLSFLMVSNVKYISFKKVELFRRHPFHTLVGRGAGLRGDRHRPGDHGVPDHGALRGFRPHQHLPLLPPPGPGGEGGRGSGPRASGP